MEAEHLFFSPQSPEAPQVPIPGPTNKNTRSLDHSSQGFYPNPGGLAITNRGVLVAGSPRASAHRGRQLCSSRLFCWPPGTCIYPSIR